jgi:hypothetical protein
MSSIGELHKILFYMKGADTVMTSIGKWKEILFYMKGADTVMSSIGKLHKILFYMKGAHTVMSRIGTGKRFKDILRTSVSTGIRRSFSTWIGADTGMPSIGKWIKEILFYMNWGRHCHAQHWYVNQEDLLLHTGTWSVCFLFLYKFAWEIIYFS